MRKLSACPSYQGRQWMYEMVLTKQQQEIFVSNRFDLLTQVSASTALTIGFNRERGEELVLENFILQGL